jgi:hypothetical protein
VWGGQQYPWNSAHVLGPLIIGAVGLIVWYIIEKYYSEFPTVPFKLLMNRTTVIGFFGTFMHGISALTIFFYWSVFMTTRSHSAANLAMTGPFISRPSKALHLSSSFCPPTPSSLSVISDDVALGLR